MEEIPVFRAAKRRKHTKGPSQTLSDVITDGPGSPSKRRSSSDNVNSEDSESDDAGVMSVIKARKNLRRPTTGVHFSTSRSRPGQDDDNEGALVKADQAVDRPIDITQRFVGSSGQVVNVDQHMIAFIDSEMAKRREIQTTSLEQMAKSTNNDSAEIAQTSNGIPISIKQAISTNPASAQQLSEVDLGSSAHELNLKRTQAALERARLGKAPIEEEQTKFLKPRKPRLGRDGKPMKPRPRKRRNSQDIARDALVEQVLHENRLDLYETSTSGQAPGGGTTDFSATDTAQQDERLAEEFRQNFLDAVAQRQQRNKAASQPKVPGATTETKGPKLGGSRSARAKMAQYQQQQQQQGKR